MQNNVYTYLKFVLFKDLENWSVSHLLGKDMGYTDKYSIVSIGEIIDKCQCPTEIKDDIQYKQITLKTNGGGAVLRGIKWGKDIGTKKQYIASDGQFIMSKIDARNGAFGIITEELDGAVVTSDFPLFNVDTTKIFPEYLALIASTKEFVKFAQSCSRGTTNRQRIDVNLFLSQQIPLPSLSEQKAIIEAYENKIQQVAMLEDQAKQVEHNIEDYLLSELGIQHKVYPMSELSISIACEPQVEYNVSYNQCAGVSATCHWGDEIKKAYKYLKFVNFKDVERWDVSFFTQKSSFVGKYESVSMNDCINSFMQDFQGNSLRIETSKYPENSYQYIGMENIEKGTGVLTEETIIKGSDVKSQTVRVPKDFFLYGKLRPYLNKYWYNESENENIVCSSEFFVFSIKKSINPYYFKYYLASSAVQQQITNAYRGARMPRINEETFKAVAVPLPPINIQNAIVEHISKQMEQIKDLKKQANDLRKEALEEFEKEIFEYEN